MDRNRILEAMYKREWSQSDLARAIGVTPGTINQILKGKTTRSKYAFEIARALNVSLSWLNGGGGPSGIRSEPSPLDFVQLTEVDVGYGMGGGTFIEGLEDQIPRVFDPDWLSQITRSPPEMVFVARGVGDSMFPTLLDSDLLLIDRAQRRIAQQDRIWALTYGELGMVKRVRRLPTGAFLLMSDNASIPPVEAAQGEFHVVGRVCWVGRKI